jgi:hypothetical protein
MQFCTTKVESHDQCTVNISLDVELHLYLLVRCYITLSRQFHSHWAKCPLPHFFVHVLSWTADQPQIGFPTAGWQHGRLPVKWWNRAGQSRLKFGFFTSQRSMVADKNTWYRHKRRSDRGMLATTLHSEELHNFYISSNCEMDDICNTSENIGYL